MSRLEEITARVERWYAWQDVSTTALRATPTQAEIDREWLLDQVATLTAERDALESERDAALLRAESVGQHD